MAQQEFGGGDTGGLENGSPQRGPEAEPLVGGSGDSLPKAHSSY